MNSRTKLLVGLLAFALLLGVWSWLGLGGDDAEEDFQVATTPPAGGALPGLRGNAPAAKPPADRVEELQVAALATRPREYTPGRNPWRFIEPPPPPPPAPPRPPPPPSAAELEARRRAQEEAERIRQAQIAEANKPKPPPFTMSYLGNFGSPERRLAVFSDGKTIYNAREGEVLAGKFIVADIGYESVEIRFVGFPDWPPQRLAAGPGSR